MILIETLNIRSGGGVNLLISLTNKLNQKNVPYLVLQNNFINLDNVPEQQKIVVENNSVLKRSRHLKAAIKKVNPTSILTYNFPPPIKTAPDIKVITDFQNLHLVDNYDAASFNFFHKMMWKAKKTYLKNFYSNTDLYIVPTSYIRKEFQATYGEKKPCQKLSYYDKENIENLKAVVIAEGVQKEPLTFIYVSSPFFHKNHDNLFKAWEVLIDQGINLKLKLTLPKNDEYAIPALEKMKALNKKGGNIININEDGFLDYKDIIAHTYSANFTIFPSFNETFGFGLVEGTLMGNKILVSNKDYAFQVVEPSMTFDPYEVDDIVACVKKAISTEQKESKLIFDDQSDLLIELLSSK